MDPDPDPGGPKTSATLFHTGINEMGHCAEHHPPPVGEPDTDEMMPGGAGVEVE